MRHFDTDTNKELSLVLSSYWSASSASFRWRPILLPLFLALPTVPEFQDDNAKNQLAGCGVKMYTTAPMSPHITPPKIVPSTIALIVLSSTIFSFLRGYFVCLKAPSIRPTGPLFMPVSRASILVDSYSHFGQVMDCGASRLSLTVLISSAG